MRSIRFVALRPLAPRAVGLAILAIACFACGTNNAADIGAPGGQSPNGPKGGGPGSPKGHTPLPCDVDRVLAQDCRSCHADPPLYGAPMPLLTYEDMHAAARSDGATPVFARVRERTHDYAHPMPPPPNPHLDGAAQATLDGWIDRGAPAADGETCAPSSSQDDGGATDSGGPPPPPTDCTFDTHVAPASPFTMFGGETYACYGFDIQTKGKKHVTQIKVHIDNPQIVHHVLLLASPGSTSGTPMSCNPAPSFGAPMIYAWAPGGLPLILPADAGFAQDETTHYLVQIHYNNAANAPNPVDATGFDLCTTPTLRKYDADVVAFGSELIIIPPRAPASVTSCYTLPASLDGRTFFGAFPHMHKLGKSITTHHVPKAGGAPVDMGTDMNWDFSNQPWVPISTVAHTGDIIKTNCTWDNPGDLPVTFGQSTTNEMCYSFTAYYPKADASLGWAAPASGSVPCQ